MTMKKYKVEVDTTTGGSYPLEKTFKSPDYAATFLQGAVTRGDFLPTTLSSYVNAKLRQRAKSPPHSSPNHHA